MFHIKTFLNMSVGHLNLLEYHQITEISVCWTSKSLRANEKIIRLKRELLEQSTNSHPAGFLYRTMQQFLWVCIIWIEREKNRWQLQLRTRVASRRVTLTPNQVDIMLMSCQSAGTYQNGTEKENIIFRFVLSFTFIGRQKREPNLQWFSGSFQQISALFSIKIKLNWGLFVFGNMAICTADRLGFAWEHEGNRQCLLHIRVDIY